jgi:hypothetical protein
MPEARPPSRRILDGRHHFDEPVFHADLDAQPAKLALGADLQFLEGLGVEVGGMRVEAGQHAVDGLGNKLLVFDAFDVVVLDAPEDFGKGAQVLDR